MKAPDFAYLRADSVEHALDALARHGDDAVVLAGGQSLMAMLNLRVAEAGVLVDINRIPGLAQIEDGGDHVAIGALVRYAALAESPLVREHLPLFALAVPHIAHTAIRNRGTLGGSLALADPAAELPACSLALGARVLLAGPQGQREVAIEDWFAGLYETAIGPGELIVEVRVPKPAAASVSRFEELARRRGDFATAGIALDTVLDGGRLRSPRIALLGVGDRPLLAGVLMRALDGAAADSLDAAAIADALDADVDPLDDPNCPADYRRHAIRVLARRTLASLVTA